MPQPYLQPEELAAVHIAGLSAEDAGAAVAEVVEARRIAVATAKAAQFLRDANVNVDDLSLERLRKLIQ